MGKVPGEKLFPSCASTLDCKKGLKKRLREAQLKPDHRKHGRNWGGGKKRKRTNAKKKGPNANSRKKGRERLQFFYRVSFRTTRKSLRWRPRGRTLKFKEVKGRNRSEFVGKKKKKPCVRFRKNEEGEKMRKAKRLSFSGNAPGNRKRRAEGFRGKRKGG